MSDGSFRRFAGWCAIGVAVAAVVYVVLLYLETSAPGLGDRLREASTVRARSQGANLMLALLGFLMTVPMRALHNRLKDAGREWSHWAAWLGFVGAVMTAAHGYWDFLRVPVLLGQWDTGVEARQAAIAAFSGVPNPVDPRGLGAFLFVGLFVLVASRLILAGKALPALVGQWGLLYGVILIVTFLAGITGPENARVALTGLTVGVVGPIWWLLVGRELLRG
jgi:hypothetical protein